MLDQKLHETIEAYLNGDLKGADLSDFETRLQSDQELAFQVSMFRDIDSAVNDKPVLNFQKLVEEQGNIFFQENDQEKTIVKKINWRNYLIAAATFILFAAAIFIIKNQSSSHLSGQDLFAQHFESYELNESLRSSNEDVNIFDEGVNKYRAKAYNESTDIFLQLVNNDSTDMTATFCLAQSSLNQVPQNFTLAKVQLEKIISDGRSIYVPASKWYLALILLKQEDLDSTHQLLLELKTEEGNYAKKARELADQIK